MHFKAIRKLDTGLGRGRGDLIRRVALFPRELWSFQVIWGLEMEDASPPFLMELWPAPTQPTPEWVLAKGLCRRRFHRILG